MAKRLHSDQGGFTLIELLTAMTIGLIILMAAALLFDTTVSTSNTIADRQEAAQQGRLAMELVTRDLRSQICLTSNRPITYGDDNTVTFYADLDSNPDTADSRSIRYVAAQKKIYEDIYRSTGTYPDLSFPGTPNTTREIISPVIPIVDSGVSRPIFRYYKYKVGGQPGELQQLTSPLSTGDLRQVVDIKVGFVALPNRTTAQNLTKAGQDATSFESDVYVRIVDPSKPTDGPGC
jgi:prepilin-type N-terminal cleavage/methylation domain-containing protein